MAEFLLSQNYDVHGVIRRSSSFNTARLENIYQDPHDRPHLYLHYGDITDAARMSELVQKIQPSEVYNLAAMSHVKVSFDEPIYTINADAVGVINILEAIRHYSPSARYLQASSSEMFGKVVEVPQTEKTPFYPRSPYACAKVYGYWQTLNYREAYGIFACNSISFNHESPRRGETFVTRKITRAATRIKEGLQKKLFLGNLDAKRDWGFAGDYIIGMWKMLQHSVSDDFVLATGETHSIKEFLGVVFGHLGLDWQKYVEQDPRYLRPSEVDLLIGNASKAKEILNWEPSIKFHDLAIMMTEADWELAKTERYVKERQ